MPTTLENVAGYDLTQLEIKVVEDKREAIFKKKATLTPQAVKDEIKKEEGEGKSSEEDDDDSEDEVEKKPADAASKGIKDVIVDPTAPVVHEGVSCDSCHMSPLVGIRYKCARYAHILCTYIFLQRSPQIVISTRTSTFAKPAWTRRNMIKRTSSG
jgi:Zinc finger, ZZ type